MSAIEVPAIVHSYSWFNTELIAMSRISEARILASEILDIAINSVLNQLYECTIAGTSIADTRKWLQPLK